MERDDLATSFPQQVEFECSYDGFWEADDDLVASADDFAGDIDESTAHGGGVACNGDDVLEDVFLERLEEEEGDKHRIVERLVLGEAFERERLGAEVLECSVGELFGPTLVVGLDDPFGLEKSLSLRSGKVLQDSGVGPEVGEDHVLRPEKLQGDLRSIFFASGSSIERSVEARPVFRAIAELDIVPDLVRVAVLAPRRCCPADVFLHVWKHFA